jgi:uncharacterized protein YndB with AHSA1/START domain
MNKRGSAGRTSTNTVRLHRVLAAKPEKVYRAFTTADAMARWLPPNGFTCTVHQMDSKVGGGHVAELVGIEGGVVSGVINLESSGA